MSVLKFCGATVTGVQSQAGYQDQSSSLLVNLVEDEGDEFINPETGTPLSFQHGSFRFDGLVRNWGRSGSVGGGFTFDVALTSPAEILDNVQVILDGFRSVNTICPNLLNVFGYLEQGGAFFGGSLKNESGIPFYLIKQALIAIGDGSTLYGPPIEFKGHTYIVDLSAVPIVPDFYRVGGGLTMSLNEILSQVFNDSGYEYITFLQTNQSQATGPHTIYFKARNRAQNIPSGQIMSFVEGRTDIVSYEAGEELRNDVTCGVLFGGAIEQVNAMVDDGSGTTIYPFWGFTNSPYTIPFGISTQGNKPIAPSTGPINDNMIVTFDATPIADIIGSTTYTCTILEMRFALANFDSWSLYIVKNNPAVAEVAGFTVFPSILTDAILTGNIQSLFSTDSLSASFFSDRFAGAAILENLERIHKFVVDQAQTWMGRSFVVRIPFILKYAFEAETNNVYYNMYPNSDGYWPDYLGGLNTGPLGLLYENFNQFSTIDGKFEPFVKFWGDDLINADLTSVSPDNVCVQADGIYMRCTIAPDIIYTPAPAVLVTLAEPLWSFAPDPLGGITEVAALLEMDPADLIVFLSNNRSTDFPIGIQPPAFRPLGAAICLRSNEQTYGPWKNIGVPGRVEVRADSELVPWNYGSFDTMDTVANAQLATIGSTNQTEESGSITLAGAPVISLGDQLNGIGPVVSDIDITYGVNGITTTYRMRSQIPIFGRFSKANADRLRRLGKATQDLRRTLRAFFTDLRKFNNTIAMARQSRVVRSQAIQQKNINSVLHGLALTDVDGNVSAQVSSQGFGAAFGNTGLPDVDAYQSTAQMGYEGLLRPFTTDIASTKLPKFENANTNVDANAFTTQKFNPFKGSDILWGAHDDDFQGLSPPTDPTIDENKMRLIGLRGPLTLIGHGLTLGRKPIPNSVSSNNEKDLSSTTYLDGYLKKFPQWKGGLIDLRWNIWNKTWTAPIPIFGTMAEALPAGGTGKRMTVDGSGGDEILVDNYFSSASAAISSGTKVVAAYHMLKHKWYIVSADCV